MKFYPLLFILIFGLQSKVFGQLTSSDSTFFSSIFTDTKYADDTTFPGNWFIHDSVQDILTFNQQLDSIFKYSIEDFNKIDSIIVEDYFSFDSVRNTTYANYPFVFTQTNPLVYLDFKLLGKKGRSYAYLFNSFTNQTCKTAYLIVPGGGENQSTSIVQGMGYHNLNCTIVNNLMNSGDVYTMVKPNEDARAIYWLDKRLNSYLVSHLDSINKNYGVNYLIELVALIKNLKKQYTKVVVLGASEGGYASLLASLVTEPDAVMVSAGYSVGFDSSIYSKDILRLRFDSLVDFTTSYSLKQKIDTQSTKYLFTWGNYDGITLMQMEYDSASTQNYFYNSLNCSFYYNYNFHSFPGCAIIDSFSAGIPYRNTVRFTPMSSTPDSIVSEIQVCGNNYLKIEVYRDTTLYTTIMNPSPLNYITLSDSGAYTLRNIMTLDSTVYYCYDTIVLHKITVPNALNEIDHSNYSISCTNPVFETLNIENSFTNGFSDYTLYSLDGHILYQWKSASKNSSVNVSTLAAGLYILHVSNSTSTSSTKILKQ
jgi:hypothetical protein